MGLSENNEHALSRRSPKFKWEFAAVIGLKLPRNLRGEYVASAKVAEGEELGSNLLRVDQRSSKQWSERNQGEKPARRLTFSVHLRTTKECELQKRQPALISPAQANDRF
jgi:hypothetical protein